MKITGISVKDYLGIRLFKADSLGTLNRITGGNGVGKSAVLKAIKEAFKSSGVDENLINVNAEKAEIMVELDSRVMIQRTITPLANNVKVTVDDAPVTSPQTFLSKLTGQFNFNPVYFFLEKGKGRREKLIAAIPFTLGPELLQESLGEYGEIVDVTQLDYSQHGLVVLEAASKLIYDKRHEQNLEVTRLKKALDQDRIDMPQVQDASKFDGFDLNNATQHLAQAQEKITQHGADEARLESLRTQGENLVASIDKLKEELRQAESDLEKIRQEGIELRSKVDEYQAPDIESVRSLINGFQDNQKLIHKLDDIRNREAELEQASAAHKKLDAAYKQLTDDVPRLLMQQVKLPIAGLEIKGDDIFVGGVKIDNLSTSEQIRFAVNVAKSLAGKLQVICIDGFEALDTDKQKIFEQETAGDEFEYFITQVTSGELKVESKETAAPAQVKGKKTTSKAGF